MSLYRMQYIIVILILFILLDPVIGSIGRTIGSVFLLLSASLSLLAALSKPEASGPRAFSCSDHEGGLTTHGSSSALLQ